MGQTDFTREDNAKTQDDYVFDDEVFKSFTNFVENLSFKKSKNFEDHFKQAILEEMVLESIFEKKNRVEFQNDEQQHQSFHKEHKRINLEFFEL